MYTVRERRFIQATDADAYFSPRGVFKSVKVPTVGSAVFNIPMEESVSYSQNSKSRKPPTAM